MPDIKIMFPCSCFAELKKGKWEPTFVCPQHIRLSNNPIKKWTWHGAPDMVVPCDRCLNGECMANFTDSCKRLCPGQINFEGVKRCRIATNGTLNTSAVYITENLTFQIVHEDNDADEGMKCTVEGNVFVFDKTEMEKENDD